MIPEHARQVLEPLMGPGIPWEDINVHVGRLPSASITPHALVRRSAMAVTASEPFRSLRTVGMTIDHDIWIARGHDDFESAAGLALLGHELVHVQQYDLDANFRQHYDLAARQTPHDQPWLNPYESQAYAEEQRIYCWLVSQGYPKGRWVPLGVTLWGCR